MSFTSFNFLFFFLLVVAAHYMISWRYRWMFLLLVSLYFYACYKLEYGILLIGTGAIIYIAGLQIAKEGMHLRRRMYLATTGVVILLMLLSFKYLNFVGGSINAFFNSFNILYNIPEFKILIPLGISFYTLKALAYAIDVYRGEIKAERNFGMLLLYLSFFPQIPAGPMERAKNLLPQFYRDAGFDISRMIGGGKLMLWGFFKKLVIADQLAVYVNQVFNHPQGYYGISLLIAVYLFTIQIYCDFSGYSDIAIGAAQMLGYDTMDNFDRPYLAESLRDFWHRWHISLSSWFRDYLYIPLGGNRVNRAHWHFNILAVFVLSGLWHGANSTFLFWGALHGALLSLSAVTAKVREKALALFRIEFHPRFNKALRILITFHMVAFAWIFFRANSLPEAFMIVGNILPLHTAYFALPKTVNLSYLVVALIATAMLCAIELMQRCPRIDDTLRNAPIWFRWPFYYLLLFAVILFGQRDASQFIYTRF